MRTIDNEYVYLVNTVAEQCLEILEAFERIEMPEDESVAPERLQGITRTPPPFERAALVFQSDETPNQRTLVFVDSIFALAYLLNQERRVPYKKDKAPQDGQD